MTAPDAADVASQCLGRVLRFQRRLDSDRSASGDGINAVTYALPLDELLRLAAESSERVVSGNAKSAIDGLVVTVKDTASLAVRGWRTTAGSFLAPDVIDESDAAAVSRVRDAGAIIAARTAAPEFGWKPVTSSPRWGVTRSAIDLSRTSGGSSGGAAASVASGMADLALGTDAAGSVRIPAAIQSVVGFKPTAGLVTCQSHQELGHVGIIARRVETVAQAMDCLARGSSFEASLAVAGESMRGRRIALCSALFTDVPDVSVAEVFRETVDEVFAGALGCRIDAAKLQVAGEEAWHAARVFHFSSLAHRLRELAPTREARARLDPGLLAALAEPSLQFDDAEVERARACSQRIAATLASFHRDGPFDLLVTPTLMDAPARASPCGEDHLDRGLAFWDDDRATPRHTFLFNLSGQPAITVPCGFTEGGEPVGLQIVGPIDGDLVVLQAAKAFQDALSSRRGAPRVVVINGPSSAGKTTLARDLVASVRTQAVGRSKPLLRRVSFDDFAAGGLPVEHWSRQFTDAIGDAELRRRCTGAEAWRYVDPRSGLPSTRSDPAPSSAALVLAPVGIAYLHATYEKWAAMLRCGESLVIDQYVMDTAWYTAMVERFAGIACKTTCVGLECDRAVLEVREALRSRLETRILGTARHSAERVHEAFRRASGNDYDVTLRSDSSGERAWAAAEYERVVLRREGAEVPPPLRDGNVLVRKLGALWDVEPWRQNSRTR